MRALVLGLVGVVMAAGAAEAKVCRLDGLTLSAKSRSDGPDAAEAPLDGAKFKIVRQASNFKSGVDPMKGRDAISGMIAVELSGDKGRFFVIQDYIPSSSPWVSAQSFEHTNSVSKRVVWSKRNRGVERKLFEPDGSFDIYSGPLGGYTLYPVNCKE